MDLLIVESPSKAKKIQGYASGFKVLASAGHIRDLPKKDLGIEKPGYGLVYEVTKPDVVKRLKEAAKEAGRVVLATDPDREGEAIAAHLRDVLKLKDPDRVTFHEITKSAIQKALNAPRKIDAALVRAQEGRRALDRLVGWRVSGTLSDVVGERASAGRVQSPAVRIVVDREREIEAFVPTKHFGVVVDFGGWGAEWDFRPLLAAGAEYWLDRAFAERVAGLSDFAIKAVERKDQERKPPAPFTTLTMQNAASVKLGLSPAKTMELAQKLFEGEGGGEGYITYHRTDTPNLSDEAVQVVYDVLRSEGLGEYIPDKPHKWKAKEGSQEAHEAIRPTHFEDLGESIEDLGARALYQLIRDRAIASQMRASVVAVTKATLESTEEIDGRRMVFVAEGKEPRFDGWRRWTAVDATDEEGEEDAQALPALAEGQAHKAQTGAVVEKTTRPPARYSQASLNAELERLGIGRPSTYATIQETILKRGYVELDKARKLRPTPLGGKVRDALVGRFAFCELDYTRQIEDALDQIAEGKHSYGELVGSVDGQLDKELGALDAVRERFPCPGEGCSGVLRRRQGKNGAFWGCSNYPECKVTRPDADGRPGEAEERRAAQEAGKDCPDCGKPLVVRNGARGPFLGCSGYPECKHAENMDGQSAPKKPAGKKRAPFKKAK